MWPTDSNVHADYRSSEALTPAGTKENRRDRLKLFVLFVLRSLRAVIYRSPPGIRSVCLSIAPSSVNNCLLRNMMPISLR
ncbi:MAG: hypothetical protein JWQ50_5716 [Caballeronia mineralivorans]|jgi:hypothetical protein|nr:hypothetical protein [Caballeronia mineralivorans]